VICSGLGRPRRLGRSAVGPGHVRDGGESAAPATAALLGAVGWSFALACASGLLLGGGLASAARSHPFRSGLPLDSRAGAELCRHACCLLWGALIESPEAPGCECPWFQARASSRISSRSSPASTRRPSLQGSGRSVQARPSSSRMAFSSASRACAGHRRCGDG